MAKCVFLEDYGVERRGGVCTVVVESTSLPAVERFERIVVTGFPEAKFVRAGRAERTGLLGFGRKARIIGRASPERITEVEDMLKLLSITLTIEDALDESHALAYHQDEDPSGELVRSAVGDLVYRAKYGRPPDQAARERIIRAVRRFIIRHPRYRNATWVAAVPPHDARTRDSLCRTIVNEVAAGTGLEVVVITRTETREKQKNIIDEDRRMAVDKRIENQRGSTHINQDLAGEAIVLIDDLYGSGGSMLESARAARVAGASEVLGLAITKQRLFEGVRMPSNL